MTFLINKVLTCVLDLSFASIRFPCLTTRYQSFSSVHVHPSLSPPSSSTMASPDAAEEVRATAYVGFDTITQQIEHKLLKRGFQFNVIVCGLFLLFYGRKKSQFRLLT